MNRAFSSEEVWQSFQVLSFNQTHAEHSKCNQAFPQSFQNMLICVIFPRSGTKARACHLCMSNIFMCMPGAMSQTLLSTIHAVNTGEFQ